MVEDKRVNGGSTPDDHRCTRNDGKKWRCSGLKFQGHNYCEKHFKQKELKKQKGKAKVQQQVPIHKQDKGLQKRKGVDSILYLEEEEEDDDDDNEEEEEEVPLIRKKRKVVVSNEEEEEVQVQVQPTITKENHTEVFSIKKSEECSISELILSLRASFGQTDFEKVVSILKGREEKVKMEKEEAEKKAACFKQELEICEDNCNKLLNEVEERRGKEANAVESKVRELERNRVVIEDKVKELERNRVVVEEDLRKYMKMCIELKTKNRELESEKTRAVNEIGFWKRKFQDLQTKGFSADGSYREEGKKNLSKQMRIESGNDCALVRGCLSNVKIKEEALDFSPKVYASPIVDSSCRFSANEGGVGQHSGSGIKDGSVTREKAACQPEGSSYKTLTSPKVEHGSITKEQLASPPDGSSCKVVCSPMVGIPRSSEGIPILNNSSQETRAKPIHFKESLGQKQNSGGKGSSSEQILASITERKWSHEEGTIGSAYGDSQFQINKCKVRTLEGLTSGYDHRSGSSDSKSCGIHTELTQPEISKDSLTSPQQKSISPQKLTEKRNGAIRTPSEHRDACKISGNSSAETDSDKKVKHFGSELGTGVNSSSADAKPEHVEDGISKFLHELRRLKASKSNWKGSPLVVE